MMKLALLTFILSFHAFAQEAKVNESMRYNHYSSSESYKKNSGNTYIKQGSFYDIEILDLNTKYWNQDSRETGVEGVTKGEYASIELIQKDSKYFVRHIIKLKTELGSVESDDQLEVYFIKGKMSDLKAGKSVQVKYTQAGLKLYKQSLSKLMSKFLKADFIKMYKETYGYHFQSGELDLGIEVNARSIFEFSKDKATLCLPKSADDKPSMVVNAKFNYVFKK